MSRDNVQFTASFIIFYRIVDTCKLAYRLGNDEVLLADCMRDIACGAFRSAVGENLLQRIIDHREEITDKCTIELNKAVMYWGIFV